MSSRVLLRRTLALSLLLAASTACSDDDNGSGPGVGTFTLGTPSTAAVTVAAGTVTTVTIPVTATGNLNPVTLSADSVPAGFTVGFSPATVTSGVEQVTVVIRADAGIAAKTGTVKIIARATDMTDQVARITVTSTAAPTYTATSSAATTPVAIQRTQSGTITVTLDRSGGFTGPVDIIADSLPAGITIVPATNVTGNTATITINTAANASAVTGTLRLRAVNPTIGDRIINVRYTVVAEPGVQIAVGARTGQQSNTDTVYVSVTREGGFTGGVTVTLSNLPAGVTAAPVNSAAGTTVAVPVTIADDATVGAATITTAVSGTGIATKTTTSTLTVNSSLLTSGTARTVADSRVRGSLRYYRVVVPAGATSLRVTLTSAAGNGDGDIYLIPPGAPSVGRAVDGSFEVDNAENVVIPNPVAGTWYIAIEVWNPYANAALTATVSTTAPAGALRSGTAPSLPFEARLESLRAAKLRDQR